MEWLVKLLGFHLAKKPSNQQNRPTLPETDEEPLAYGDPRLADLRPSRRDPTIQDN